MANYKILFPFILSWEGGFVNDPNDLGGATNKGVTLKNFQKWRNAQMTTDDLKIITDEEVCEIMKVMYWDKCHADRIEKQSIANAIVDWVWCSGISGIKRVQKILNVKQDGIIGPKTLFALNNKDSVLIFHEIIKEREKFLTELTIKRPQNKIFLNGWLRRVSSIKYDSLITNDGRIIKW